MPDFLEAESKSCKIKALYNYLISIQIRVFINVGSLVKMFESWKKEEARQ